MVGAFRLLAAVVFVLSIPAALLTTNVRFIIDEQRVYRHAIDEFGGVQATRISRAELLRASAELRAYFKNSQDVVAIRVEQGGREVSLFNPRETAHLKDVKDRFHLVNRIQEFSVLYLLVYVAAVVLWAREVTLRGLALRVVAGCVLTMALIGGSAAIETAGDAVRLLWATPQSGYTVTVDAEGPEDVKVKFKSTTHISEFHAIWTDHGLDVTEREKDV